MDHIPASRPTTNVDQTGHPAGGISTYYQQTATHAVMLPCGGCPLVLRSALAGYGQAGRLRTTTTTACWNYYCLFMSIKYRLEREMARAGAM